MSADKKMTADELTQFNMLFKKYCDQEIAKGHCVADGCDGCPITAAYNEIFTDSSSDEDEEDE